MRDMIKHIEIKCSLLFHYQFVVKLVKNKNNNNLLFP